MIPADEYVGWGWRPSGRRAARKGPRFLLEDGFLSGFSPKLGEPVVSYTLDTVAPHYDATHRTDLERRIASTEPNGSDIERARGAIETIRRTGISKWNDAPVQPLRSLGITKPFLLLIDQVASDLSLKFGTPPDAFERMLEVARAEAAGRQIVVRAHPVATGPLTQLCRGAPDVLVCAEPSRLAPLIAEADAVYTVASHAGFEALLHGKPVHCFGAPFYAGWGLTDDEVPIPERNARPSLEAVFAAAYIQASRYLDLHDRTSIALEEAIDQLVHVRDARMELRRHVVTVGMSPWKRRATAPFLVGPGGRAKHRRNVPRGFAGDIVVWGADAQPHVGSAARIVRLEDGLLRSRGLGAALRFPLSLYRATDAALPFDARSPNLIERSLLNDPPSDDECARARDLRHALVGEGATKYMLHGRVAEPLLPGDGRMRVLVIGQVEGDASLRYGSPAMQTNDELLHAVHALFPNALIAYRDHPDVRAGLRDGRASHELYDLDVTDHDLNALFAWCDRVETITSGTGFEALLRGVPVGTHGWPFYAGWGLTDDRLPREPRGTANIDTLVAVALVRSPIYIHPRSAMPCTPERLLEALQSEAPRSPLRLAIQASGATLGRTRRLLRRRG